MMNYKNFLVGVFFLLNFLKGQAQESSTTSGGDALGGGGTVSFSIGQVVYTTNSVASGVVSQGVQQPYEIFTVGILEETPIEISLEVFPNPTTNSLTLLVENFTKEKMNYQIFDVHGKLLASDLITANQTLINMSSFSEATYFLQITHENKIVKSFKVFKN